jgi:hypothetical protein
VIGSPRGIVPTPLFGKLPTRIRRFFDDGPGEFWCVRAEILLKHNVIGGDNKRFHLIGIVFARKGPSLQPPWMGCFYRLAEAMRVAPMPL